MSFALRGCRSSSAALALAAAAALASCSSVAHFRPREHLSAESPEGHPAAQYALAEGEARGELRLWSRGAWTEDEPEERTVLHVGLELENDGAKPIAIESMRLEELVADEARAAAVLEPASKTGELHVPPRSMRRVDFRFHPPAGLDPHHIDAFAARWVLRDAAGGTFEQSTPFRRYRREPRYYGSTTLFWGFPFGYSRYCW